MWGRPWESLRFSRPRLLSRAGRTIVRPSTVSQWSRAMNLPCSSVGEARKPCSPNPPRSRLPRRRAMYSVWNSLYRGTPPSGTHRGRCRWWLWRRLFQALLLLTAASRPWHKYCDRLPSCTSRTVTARPENLQNGWPICGVGQLLANETPQRTENIGNWRTS